ncbi:Uncharacterised protein [Mycobacterium tuberculosis]|nr:Uncharacterised protein [Mycobacterium tuberculosis]CPA74491.1 Uncharacterised protein [Mycobacterium tuberculosis]
MGSNKKATTPTRLGASRAYASAVLRRGASRMGVLKLVVTVES